MNKGENGNGTPKRPRHSQASLSPDTPPQNTKKYMMTNTGEGEDDMKSMMREMMNSIREIKADFGQQLSTLNNTIEDKFGNWMAEKAEINRKQSELEARIDQLERQQKRNSIIITGLSMTDNRTAKTAVDDLFRQQMGLDATVAEAFVIKLRSGENKIIAKMLSFEDKLRVMKNKSALSKSGKIYLSDDLIKKDQFVQFKAREFAKQKRAEGKDAKVGNKRVVVDDVIFVWDDEGQTFTCRKN